MHRWLRCGWRTFKWLSLLLLVVLIVYITWTNHRGRTAVEQMIVELEQRDIPRGLLQWKLHRRGSAWDAWWDRPWVSRRCVEPAKNAALRYEAAALLTDAINWNAFDVPYIGSYCPDPPELCERIHPELARQLDTIIKQHSEVFQLLAEASTLEQCDFGIDPTHAPLPHHNPFGAAASVQRMLQLQCLHAQANNDTKQVATSIGALFDLAMRLNDEPGFLTGIVQLRWQAVAIYMLEKAMSRMELTEPQLVYIQEKIGQQPPGDLLVRAAASELAIHHAWLQGLSIQNIHERYPTTTIYEDGVEPFGLPGWVGRQRRRDWQNQIASLWLSLCPGWLELRAVDPLETMLNQYDDVVANGATPDALRAFQRRWRDRRETHPDRDNTQRWIISTTAHNVLLNRALEVTAMAALAVERYRLEHQQWPVRLEDLNTELPNDPYTGEPLRYRRIDNGVIIYSVGENGKDDNGVRASDPGSPVEADDWDFQLYDAQVRNSQPAVFRERQKPEPNKSLDTLLEELDESSR
jgi:hypothetical protein